MYVRILSQDSLVNLGTANFIFLQFMKVTKDKTFGDCLDTLKWVCVLVNPRSERKLIMPKFKATVHVGQTVSTLNIN